MKKLLMAICSIFMASCSNDKINQYEHNYPKLSLQEFLNGKITGYGIIEDFRSNVTKRFQFSGTALWTGDSGRFDEKITYSDGKVESRVWQIKKLSESSYEAYNPDLIGIAKIKVSGNAMNWQYTMKIKVDDSIYKINFDDWMYLMPDGQLINRNYFKKFGITVGELTLFMQKESI